MNTIIIMFELLDVKDKPVEIRPELEQNSPHLSESADLLDTFVHRVVHLFFCGEPANTKPNTHTHAHTPTFK